MEEYGVKSSEPAPVLPYAGSCGWYRRLLADTSFPQPQGHALTRAVIAGDTRLSVPVEGGNRRLRRSLSYIELRQLAISGHGDWTHVHLGALNAIYGRAPFFAHYFPFLQRAYASASPGSAFADFTQRIHDVVAPLISHEALAPFLRMRADAPALFNALRRERLPFAPDSLSILHPLFHLGPELPFAIMAHAAEQ